MSRTAEDPAPKRSRSGSPLPGVQRQALPRALRIGLYALLYAVAITALVIFAPGEPQVFIYQGF